MVRLILLAAALLVTGGCGAQSANSGNEKSDNSVRCPFAEVGAVDPDTVSTE